MSKKVGDMNYFNNDRDYLLKEALGYLEKKGIYPNKSWYVGGNLHTWANNLGLEPVRKSENGGRKYYDYKSMYILVHALEKHLKKKKAKSACKQTSPTLFRSSGTQPTTTPIITQPKESFAEEPEQITIEDVINATNTMDEAFKALYKSVSECCDTLNEVKKMLGGYYGRL